MRGYPEAGGFPRRLAIKNKQTNKTQLAASSPELLSTSGKMQSSTCGRFPDKIHTFRFFASASAQVRQDWRKPSADRKPGLVAEREGAAAGLTSPPRRGSAHPKSYSRPTPQFRIHGSLRGNGRSLRIPGGRFSFGNCFARPAPVLSSRSAPRHAHTLTLPVPERRPPPACPEARAGAAPPRSRPRLHKLVCPWPAGKKPCPQPARGSRLKHPGGRTHPRPRPAEAPASAATRPPPRGAEPAAPQCPEPSAPSARTPRGGPRQAARRGQDTGRSRQAPRGCGRLG